MAQGLEANADSAELLAEAAACEVVKGEIAEAAAALAAQDWAEAKELFDSLENKMLASLVCKLGLAAAELGLDNPAQALRNTLSVSRTEQLTRKGRRGVGTSTRRSNSRFC